MIAIRPIAALLAVLLGVSPLTAAPPRIVQKSIPGGFKVSIIDFVGGDQNEAQAMITPTVQKLCGQLTPRSSRFFLKAKVTAPKGKALKPGRFEQEITCVKPSVAEPNVATGPFTATEADDSLVRSTALKFLALRDSGLGKESFAMLSPTMQETTDPVEWAKTVGSKPRIIGGSVERRISKVTWYVDPPGVQAGVYAAADFGGRSSGLAIHCGYVALKRQPAGSYRIARLEEGRITSDNAKGLTNERLLEMRATLQCRD
jgi:Protein of unknown function (DUF4019)